MARAQEPRNASLHTSAFSGILRTRKWPQSSCNPTDSLIFYCKKTEAVTCRKAGSGFCAMAGERVSSDALGQAPCWELQGERVTLPALKNHTDCHSGGRRRGTSAAVETWLMELGLFSTVLLGDPANVKMKKPSWLLWLVWSGVIS